MSILIHTILILMIGCGGQDESTQSAVDQNTSAASVKKNQPPLPKCQFEINDASDKDMLKMDGIGPEMAVEIINYRRAKRSEAAKNGQAKWNFKSWVDVMKIDGIDETICEKNKSKICFNGRPSLGCKTGI